MRKRALFDFFWGWEWPDLKSLEPYFLDTPEQRWPSEGGSDSASLTLEGVEGTEHLPLGKGRIDVRLTMWGSPKHGVLLIYEKRGGGYRDVFSSKGDLTRLGELIRSTHDTPLPVGLFIPFDVAWKAVKEFIETEGAALPKSIEWIANRDLPANTFPDP
jgi:Immunity protein Imm1